MSFRARVFRTRFRIPSGRHNIVVVFPYDVLHILIAIHLAIKCFISLAMLRGVFIIY